MLCTQCAIHFFFGALSILIFAMPVQKVTENLLEKPNAIITFFPLVQSSSFIALEREQVIYLCACYWNYVVLRFENLLNKKIKIKFYLKRISQISIFHIPQQFPISLVSSS